MHASDIAAIVVTIAVLVLGVALALTQAARNRRPAPPPHSALIRRPECITLYVLTNTEGQICKLDGRPVITSDLEEARYLQARLMEHETMTVITVYTPDHII